MYGISTSNKLTRSKKAKVLNGLAIIYSKWVFKQDGIDTRLTKDNINKYLEGWLEWSQDLEYSFESIEDSIDTVQDNLVWSNIHFMRENTEVYSKDKEIISKKVYDILSK